MKHNLENLLPLYQVIKKQPSDIEKTMHQTMALLLHDDLDKNEIGFSDMHQIGAWIEQNLYQETSAAKVVALLDELSMVQTGVTCYIVQELHFETLKWRIKLFFLKKKKINLLEILNYMFMIYRKNRPSATLTDFNVFLNSVITTPKLYFDEKEKK